LAVSSVEFTPRVTRAHQEPFSRPDFELLLDGIQGGLRAYIISLLGPEADSDDVLQETNLFLCERWSDFEPGTSFRAWSFRVAYFKALACRRDRIRRDRLEFSEATLHRIAERGAELYSQTEERHSALQHCLSRMKRSDRALLAIRYTTGFSLTDYAKKQHRTADAVHKAVFRLRLALRQCIDRHLRES
jgi:RNA polymerase sigma-70 factor (ECF subfamily)